jgi:flagellar biosynthesis GTPase FlhF
LFHVAFDNQQVGDFRGSMKDLELDALTETQQAVVGAPLDSRIFLAGPAGAGKTTAGAARLAALLSQGVPGNQILAILPQRTLARPYLAPISKPWHPNPAMPGEW